MTTIKKSASKTVHASETAATGTAAATPAVAPTVTTVTPASSLADRVKQASAYIERAISVLAITAPALTAQQRKGMSKLRKGGDKLVPQIAQIAQAWSVQIRTQPTAAMTSAMQLATELQPLLTLMQGFLQEVQDTGYQAESDSWSTASALYVVLKRMSKKDPKLVAQLAPIQEFFKYRHKSVAGGKEAKRKSKQVAAAEAIVAEQPAAATAAPVAAAAPASAANVAGAAHA